jgi:hypothetical protein
VQTVTGDDPDAGSTAPAEETGDEPGGTTDERFGPQMKVHSGKATPAGSPRAALGNV